MGWYLLLLLVTRPALAKLVREELTLTWELGAPNGQVREMIFTNGVFPAPNFFWEEDDDIEVVVHNRMPFNNSVHWHGMLMQGTPWSDGAPGLTQKPIEPDESFVYRFKAFPAGTHWYHSHSRMNLLDGLYGGIFIRPKEDASAPWSLISNDSRNIEAMAAAAATPELVMISDWSKFKSWEYMAAQEDSNYVIFCVDSILINGKGSVHCPGEEYVVDQTSNYMKWALYPSHVNDKGCFPFIKATEGPFLESGHPETIPHTLQKGCVPSAGEEVIIEADPQAEWVSLNLICASTFKAIIVSIDEHPMWVYEADGQYIQPQRVDTLTLYTGERYAVLVKLDRAPRDYTIRVADSGITQIIATSATLRYRGPQRWSPWPSRGVLTYGGQNTTPVATLDRKHLRPFPPHAPAAHSDAMHLLRTHRWYAPWKYTLSGGGMYAEDRSATAPLLYDPHSADAQNESLIIRTKNGSWVDLVVQVGSHPAQPQEFPHLLHKHTGKVWQIGSGNGIWQYATTDEAIAAEPASFNLVDPPYRDTFITWYDGPSWIALRYQVTNPGPWLFHCHIEIHLSGGMAVAILDGVDVWPEVPPEYAPDQRGFLPGEEGVEIAPSPHQPVEATSTHDDSTVKTQENIAYWNGMLRKVIGFLESLVSVPST
ncbi:hypothetical protein ASPZODRAFT_56502 [Penicilliopsis zonata CBS 506.65]|uniref:Uncharacterized protein n=1 Tax=Penicilliopsis zonata CBS 506.65 TaxID=1073090 RepID=A0A1L9SVI5_9EURO|nr:hypothetical protein ASPZODRAFT_56502 [Penicilliopsis zonata CBS 506.65]OJJ51097.1 hypothetical protein ASPZODRAFT_56502 [Penicilliopsis zonata CBS 506.65]